MSFNKSKKFLIGRIKDNFNEILGLLRKFQRTIRILRPNERRVILILSLVVIVCAIILFRNYYLTHTTLNPQKGGVYTEGIVGSAKYINPLLARSEIDRDLSKIIFLSLIDYNSKGELVPILAQEFKVSDQGLKYNFVLGENYWQDGEKIIVRDVEFTLSILQSEGYNGPFSHSFDGVKIEKRSENEFSFVLPEINSSFPSILSELGILPVHKLEQVEPGLLDKNDFNLNPIGSGRYRFEAKKDKSNSIILSRASTYKKDNEGFFEQVVFRSYQSQGELVEAYKKGEINGFGGLTPADLNTIDRKTFRSYHLQIPRFTAVFFNLEGEANKELKFRQALAQAINKEKIIEEVYGGRAEILKTVIPSFVLGSDLQITDYPYNPETSRLYLSGLNNPNLEMIIYTTDDPSLQKIAELVSADWEAVGVKSNIIVVDLLTLEKTIIPLRQYDAVILGENLDYPPDPYPYFHSSEIKDGLNISAYKNLAADSLLEDTRLSIDPQVRTEKLKSFSKIIAEDLPVIPLASPPYLYGTNISVKGIIKTRTAGNSSDRFFDIGSWYIKTQRKSNF